jgi:uroporphyrinogen-III synthase
VSEAGPPRVVVTRPAGQAGPWVEQLRAAGVDALALPLIAIVPVADRGELVDAWQSLPERRLVVFVSVNAVQHFFAAKPAASAWPPSLSAAGPGAGTARALRDAGVSAADIVAPASARRSSTPSRSGNGCANATGPARVCWSCAAAAAATGSRSG